MSERTISFIDVDLTAVKNAISSYTSFYNGLADIYDSHYPNTKKLANELHDGFMDAYVGENEEVIKKVDSICTQTDELGKSITSLLDSVGGYIQELQRRLNELGDERIRAEREQSSNR